MTNITGVVLITISTNWVTTGTFVPKTGTPQEVQVGSLITNTTTIFVWEGVRHETVLRSQRGPEVGERRIPRPSPTNSVGGGISSMVFPSLPK